MVQETEAFQPHTDGEAAWKIDRDATEKRNAGAKQRAHEHETSGGAAALHRERRLAAAEAEQLEALNKTLGR